MVLIIIGLIVGSVMVGRELIKSAQIRQQIKQIEAYDAAIYTFQGKYNGLPGDVPNSSQFFSTALTGAAEGNGNGIIEFAGNDFYDNGINWDTQAGEVRRFFVQLGEANLIEGKYDGSRYLTRGVPRVRMNDNAGFFVASSANFQVGGSGRLPDNTINYRRGSNVLWLVACNSSNSGSTGSAPTPTVAFQDEMYYWDDFCAIFSPQDLQTIDSKIDDGNPLSGRFFGFGGHASTYPAPGPENDCLSNPLTSNATYKAATTTKQCQAAYVLN